MIKITACRKSIILALAGGTLLFGLLTASLAVEISSDEIPKLETISGDTEGCSTLEGADEAKIRTAIIAFTNMQVLTETIADPLKFSKLMAALNDPATIHLMSKCSMNPGTWNLWLTQLSDREQIERAMKIFMNPVMYMNWMMAPFNPAFYSPMASFMSPEYYSRWMNAFMNPVFYQPMQGFLNPQWYAPRIEFFMNAAESVPTSTQPTASPNGN